MRVVLDTNVVVSALLTHYGTCQKVLDHVLENETFCLSQKVFDEYADVLLRPKIQLDQADVNDFLERLMVQRQWAEHAPAPIQTIDPNDQMFLDLAFAAMADFLVTGNKKDYPLRVPIPFKILTPAEYLKVAGI
jgi:putative PIN family toxin of toxin-antitoxin system